MAAELESHPGESVGCRAGEQNDSRRRDGRNENRIPKPVQRRGRRVEHAWFARARVYDLRIKKFEDIFSGFEASFIPVAAKTSSWGVSFLPRGPHPNQTTTHSP